MHKQTQKQSPFNVFVQVQLIQPWSNLHFEKQKKVRFVKKSRHWIKIKLRIKKLLSNFYLTCFSFCLNFMFLRSLASMTRRAAILTAFETIFFKFYLKQQIQTQTNELTRTEGFKSFSSTFLFLTTLALTICGLLYWP